MTRSSGPEPKPRLKGELGHEIDWDAYATQYDLLARYNPSYAENIALMRQFILPELLDGDTQVLDVGAGTGNYICALAQDCPKARFVHLDSDPVMNRIASTKYQAAGIEDVQLVCAPAQEADFEDGAFDLIICINALYAMPSRDEVLRKIRRWAKPDGLFFIIDFGRRTVMTDWARYILGHVIREKGLVECVKFLLGSAENIRQNRRGSKGQAQGVYWLHSTDEFKQALESAGFSVQHVQSCYRGYCDLALCKPA